MLYSNFYVITVLELLGKWNVTDDYVSEDGTCFTMFRSVSLFLSKVGH